MMVPKMTFSTVNQDGRAGELGQDISLLNKDHQEKNVNSVSSDRLRSVDDIESDAEKLHEELGDSQLVQRLLLEEVADDGHASSGHIAGKSAATNQDAKTMIKSAEAQDKYVCVNPSLFSFCSAKSKPGIASWVNAEDHKQSPSVLSAKCQKECKTSDDDHPRNKSIRSSEEAVRSSQGAFDSADLDQQLQSDFHSSLPSSPVSPAGRRRDKQSQSNATSYNVHRNTRSARNALKAEYEQEQGKLHNSLDFAEWLAEKLAAIPQIRCHDGLEYKFVGFSGTSHRRQYELIPGQKAVSADAPRNRSAEEWMKEIMTDPEVEAEERGREQLISQSRGRE